MNVFKPRKTVNDLEKEKKKRTQENVGDYLLSFRVGITAMIDKAGDVSLDCSVYDCIWPQGHEVVVSIVILRVTLRKENQFNYHLN